VEFALVLPVLLLVLLLVIDFGRVFLGWVSITNAARVAANYAAQNPTGWPSGPATIRDEYQTLIGNDLTTIDCTAATPYPAPVFNPDGRPGSAASVTLTCSFDIITPLVSAILPDPLPLGATAIFPVRAGALVPGASTVPVPPAVTPSPSPTPTPTPDPNATPTPPPTPTPTPTCIVPQLTGDNSAQAQREWTDSGFTGNVLFEPRVPPQYQIGWQSLSVGTNQPCVGTNISVTP
jgi:hypothetical protein